MTFDPHKPHTKSLYKNASGACARSTQFSNASAISSTLDHTWVEAQEQLTLGDLLEQVSGKDYLELHVGVKTGKDEHSPTLKIFFVKKKNFLPTYP